MPHDPIRVADTKAWLAYELTVLAWHDAPFRKTHDLAEIGRQCASLVPSLESLLRRAAHLTQYAWKFRYRGEPEEPSREEAERAIALAREVFEAIASRLSQDADFT